MKLKLLFTSMGLVFISASANAIVGGTDVIESDYPQFVNFGCSGSIVAGRYVLTAAHCEKTAAKSVIKDNPIIGFVGNPDWIANGYDVGIATLKNIHPVNTVSFLSDVPMIDENVHADIYGWSTGSLKRATMLTRAPLFNVPQALYLKFDNNGYAAKGDSGAPVLINNAIVSIENGTDGSHEGDNGEITSRIEYSRDFILKTINDWHSPTELKFTGTKTIEIQSLHVNNTNLALRQNNGSLSSGDVTVTGGSCITDGIAPFGICTLEMKSGPYEGKVVLDDGNEITINRGKKPTPPNPDPDGKSKGGGGGSLGWLTLLALLPLAWRRK
ncbi:trypsin-like serine protease [Photobacterium leiognathi]|uniref:trypsin-like serine protease n=1 Tax=Photobacterium leiognathi TaxID=553611 RepID=UPI00273951AC|nr:trypsin-like serine protease [Photobacterium leiognathi]